MSGAGFLPSGATYVLKRLRSESPASEAGLREGDQLASMDGTPAEELRWRALERRLSAGDGRRVELEVRRAGTVIAVELTLRRRLRTRIDRDRPNRRWRRCHESTATQGQL